MNTDSAALARVKTMPTSELSRILKNMDLYMESAQYRATGQKYLGRHTRNKADLEARMDAGMATLRKAIQDELAARAQGKGRA